MAAAAPPLAAGGHLRGARARGGRCADQDRDSAGWPAVASLGTRPTVDGTEPLLEVHLFDFAGDLYGRELEVEFVARLRDEQALRIARGDGGADAPDAAAARAALAPLV